VGCGWLASLASFPSINILVRAAPACPLVVSARVSFPSYPLLLLGPPIFLPLRSFLQPKLTGIRSWFSRPPPAKNRFFSGSGVAAGS
jgi:hypothetical protein